MNFRAFNSACSTAWAITPESLQTILEIASRENLPNWEAVEAQRARYLDNGEKARVRNGVAILSVNGPIFRYANLFTSISGATSVETLARDFNAALNDRSVNSILLNIDSPGGDANGINEFAQMVFDARGIKPITAYVGGLGASAAYWIASAADSIVADKTALLGSIGVIAAVPNPDAKKASDVQFVSNQSPKKRPNPNTESGKDQIQAMVDDLASVFIDTVARNRSVSTETVLSEFGQGGVMIGEKAVAAGLADSLGNFEQTLAQMAAGKSPRRKVTTAATAAEVNTMTLEDVKTAVAEALTGLGFKAKAEQKTDDTEALVLAEAARIQAETDAQQLREQLAAQQVAQAKANAEAFVDGQIVAGKVFPAEKESLLKSYLQASADDASAPLVEGSRVEILRAQIEARPSHGLTTPAIDGGELRRLSADDNGQTESSETRRKELLSMTPLGQAAAARSLKLVN